MRVSFFLVIMTLLSALVHAGPEFKAYRLAGVSLTGGLDFPVIKTALGYVDSYYNDEQKTRSNICYYSKNKEIVFIFFNDNMARGFIMRRPIDADLEHCGSTAQADVHISGIRLGDTHDEYIKEVKIPIELNTLDRVEHVYAESAQLTNIETKKIYQKSFQDLKWDQYIKLIEHAGEVVDVQADFKNSLLVEVLMSYSIQF